jgi:putative hydrolase of the HAD superfamily
MAIRLVALDADDTLWHNEPLFQRGTGDVVGLLSAYGAETHVREVMGAVHRRNMGLFGYGAKSFTLSMIDAALTLGGERLSPAVVGEILALGKRLMTHPVELLPGVEEAVARLADRHRLVLVTKGDLFHQEQKLAASGIGSHFHGVEIVSDKTPEVYRAVWRRYGVSPDEALMVGNSPRSDVLPALESGAYAAFVPYDVLWDHEHAVLPDGHPRLVVHPSLGAVADWLETAAGG